MGDRNRNRSDNYQWVIVESPCSPEFLAEVPESDGIGAHLNPWGYNEELKDLKERLRSAFWRIVDSKLTPRQKQVMHMVSDGYTQTQIAKKLGVNQSSITKSINGNCDYKNGKRLYGGSKKKIKKIIEQDPEVQEILKRILEIESE